MAGGPSNHSHLSSTSTPSTHANDNDSHAARLANLTIVLRLIKKEFRPRDAYSFADTVTSALMGVLYSLLGKLPHVIGHYLEQLVFPLTMQHQTRKLSANGQDLGSASLFGCRLGFSGTPSDLLPIDFGVAQYQTGDDAKRVRPRAACSAPSIPHAPDAARSRGRAAATLHCTGNSSGDP